MIKKLGILIGVLLSLTLITSVKADEKVFIEKVELIEKTDTTVKADVASEGTGINFDIEFQTLGDYAKFLVIINNSTNKDYVFELGATEIEDFKFTNKTIHINIKSEIQIPI